MASLYSLLASKVSQKYHKRLGEIAHVLDPSITYRVKVSKTLAEFKYNLDLCLSKDQHGFQNIFNTMTVYNGKVITYPHKKITGDFVFVVVSARLLNPVSNTSKNEHTILIYEQAEISKQKFKGVV